MTDPVSDERSAPINSDSADVEAIDAAIAAAVNPARIDRDLAALAEMVEPGEPGWTRRVFSDAYRSSRDHVAALMRDAGLSVGFDAVGNIIGERPAQRSSSGVRAAAGALPALATGSHTDTVRGGGRFDGIIGVLGAIEAVRALDTAGIELRHPLRVVDFLGEEPNRFGVSCIGSRAINGTLGPTQLAEADADGSTLADALRGWGVDPDRVPEAAWSTGSLRAFVELHIEQGPVLDDARETIGVVTGIFGVRRAILRCRGQADHAGTTPMHRRRDALALAAEVIGYVEDAADDGHGVATVGRIEVVPNAINVVPAGADCWVELRSMDPAWTSVRAERIFAAAEAAAHRRGLTVEVVPLSDEAPTPASVAVRDQVRAVAASLGMAHRDLPSGAEHDARQMARLAPYGMVFVPSVDGRSHTPEEHTEAADVAAGVAVLAATLARLDTAAVPVPEEPT